MRAITILDSNQFFEQFPNCLTYRNAEEFSANLYWALHHDPSPLTPELRYVLSWDAATERLMGSSTITRDMQLKAKAFVEKVRVPTCYYYPRTIAPIMMIIIIIIMLMSILTQPLCFLLFRFIHFKYYSSLYGSMI